MVVGDLDGPAAQAVAEQIVGQGGRAATRTTDTSDEASVAELVGFAVAEYGGLDLLHANAADLSPEIIGRDSNVVDVPLEVFDRTMEVNMPQLPPLRPARGAGAAAAGGGALVFTSSVASFVGEPERPSYAMAKSAINALVRHIASCWGKQGIHADTVAPGLVLTAPVRDSIAPEFRDQALSMTRSARLGRPEDIAAMVAYLGSDDGEWINGQVFSVDGGAVLR